MILRTDSFPQGEGFAGLLLDRGVGDEKRGDADEFDVREEEEEEEGEGEEGVDAFCPTAEGSVGLIFSAGVSFKEERW